MGSNHMDFRKLASSTAVAMTLTAASVHAQDLSAIETELTKVYQTAKPTADGTDLVTAGSVLILQKDHLVMSKVDQQLVVPDVYKNGTITSGVAGVQKMAKIFSGLGAFNPLGANAAAQSAAASSDANREFVAGEKFFVTKIDTRTDGVTLTLLSDPIKDVRYRATLKFPFAKGAAPSPDDVVALVGEVVKIDAPEQDQTASSQQGSAAAPAQTKTIAIGQTRDEVIAQFGVPSKVVQLGKKEIDVFSDMKVTFVENKVVDVK
jgi:hypothetical protein